MFLGNDFINGIVNFKILVPIRYHKASGSQQQEINLADHVVENLIQRRGGRITQVPAKTVRSDSWK